MLRFAMRILSTLLPRFLPQIMRYLALVRRLTFDQRVSIILRSLTPLALAYVLIPTDLVKDSVPVIGRFDDFIVLGLALLFLIKLSPRQIVDEYLGKRSRSQDSSQVVDGSVRFIDDE